MSGFIITNLQNCNLIFDDFKNNNTFRYGNNIIHRSTNNNFMDDKIFWDSEEIFAITEGVILNKNDLLFKNGVSSLEELILSKIRKGEEEFFSEFRGSFSGVTIDKNKDNISVYTNHYGDNAVFYYYSRETEKYIIASQIDWLIDTLRDNDIEYSLNEQAIYYMLTYAFMPDDSTYSNEIKRLQPGHYLTINNGVLADTIYYELKRDKLNTSTDENQIIEEMDRLFRNAIRLEYDKDLEYGKKHIAELSGGLDSRMNYWVAHEMGYKDFLTIDFCQSNYTDEIVAKQIAAHWNEEILVWPMDSGKHLLDIDEIIGLNFGVSLYSGPGAELRIMDTLDMDRFGIMHTGQIGDVVFGTFIKNIKELNVVEQDGMYSKVFLDEYEDVSFKKYKNKEEQLMMTRAILGCLGAHFVTRKYTEVASPFLNVDLLDYMLSIPLELRINHYIYKKWILKKYPQAADFIWERTKEKVNVSKWMHNVHWFWTNSLIAIRNPKTVLKFLGFNVDIKMGEMKSGMNPVDKWLEDNPELNNYINDYFYASIDQVEVSEKLRELLIKAFSMENAIVKTQVLTVIKACNLYGFLQEDNKNAVF